MILVFFLFRLIDFYVLGKIMFVIRFNKILDFLVFLVLNSLMIFFVLGLLLKIGDSIFVMDGWLLSFVKSC